MGPGLRQGLIEVQEMAALLVFPHPLVHDTLLCCPLLSVPPGSRAVGDLSWRESGLPVKGHQPGAGSGQKAWAPLGFSIQYVWDLPSTAQRSAPLELLSRFHGNHSPPSAHGPASTSFLASPHPSPERGPVNAVVTTGTGRELTSLSSCAAPSPTPGPLPEMAGPVPAFQKWVVT